MPFTVSSKGVKSPIFCRTRGIVDRFPGTFKWSISPDFGCLWNLEFSCCDWPFQHTVKSSPSAYWVVFTKLNAWKVAFASRQRDNERPRKNISAVSRPFLFIFPFFSLPLLSLCFLSFLCIFGTHNRPCFIRQGFPRNPSLRWDSSSFKGIYYLIILLEEISWSRHYSTAQITQKRNWRPSLQEGSGLWMWTIIREERLSWPSEKLFRFFPWFLLFCAIYFSCKKEDK